MDITTSKKTSLFLLKWDLSVFVFLLRGQEFSLMVMRTFQMKKVLSTMTELLMN